MVEGGRNQRIVKLLIVIVIMTMMVCVSVTHPTAIDESFHLVSEEKTCGHQFSQCLQQIL